MASQASLHKGKNNFPSSVYTLGLDKLLDCISEANGSVGECESQNYIIQREKVTQFAEKLVSDIKSYKNTIRERDTEITQLNKQLTSAIQDNKSRDSKLNEDLKSSRREIARIQSKIQRMENETEKLSKTKKELQEDNNNITIKMNWAQNRLKTELETHVACKSELENTQRKLVQVSEEKEQIHSEFKNIILQYENSGEAFAKGTESAGGVNLQKEVIDGLKGELEYGRAELKEVCERENTLKDQVVKLGEENLHYAKQVEKGEKWKQKSEQFKSELEHLKTQLNTHKDDTKAAKENCSELRGKNKSLTDINQMQQKKLAQQENKLEKLNLKFDTLSSEHTVTKAELIAARNEIILSEYSINVLKQKIEEVSKENEKLNAKCHEFSELSQRFESKAAKEKQLEKSLETIKLEFENCKHNHLSLQKRETELVATVDSLTAETTTLKQSNSEFENTNTELEININSLKNNLEKATNNIEYLTGKCEDSESHMKSEIDRLSVILQEKESCFKLLQQKLIEQKNEKKILEKKQNQTMRDISKLVKAQADKLGSMERIREEHVPLSPATKELSHSTPILTNTDAENKEENISVLFETIDNFAVKIERLQLELNQKKDKINFQEDHLKHLTKELQKKARIMQNIVERNENLSIKSPTHSIGSSYEHNPEGGLSYEISLQQQLLVEDTLMRNIALQASLEFVTKQAETLEQENSKLRSLIDNQPGSYFTQQ